MQPNPYCETLPTQLRAWDSTSLDAYMRCPRYYQHAIVEGYRLGGNYDIAFGSLYHECVEFYDRAKVNGASKAEATEDTIEYLLRKTWDYDNDKPWSGTYVAGWRCNAWTAGPKRNTYRCDAARDWFSGHVSKCPKCAGAVTNRWVWGPEHKKKNRYTLLTAVLQYCDEQPETGGVVPLKFPDGQIALELSFNLELPYESPDSKPYLLCGHLDGIVSVAGEHCVRERKTTGSSLSISFFDRYAPNVQIDNYDLAANLLFGPTLHPTAVMIEVMQVGVEFARLQRGFITITEGRREETLKDLGYWIKQAEQNAKDGYYPKNTSACNANGGCPFRRVCKEEPGDTRKRLLEAHYRKEHWNPLEER